MLLAITIVKVIMFSSVVYVWAIRYSNIVQEFKDYDYPYWLRDIVGIAKLSAVVLVLQSDTIAIQIGASVIGVLMFAAMTTHVVFKNPIIKMLPSTTLFLMSCFLLWSAI